LSIVVTIDTCLSTRSDLNYNYEMQLARRFVLSSAKYLTSSSFSGPIFEPSTGH